MKKIIILLAILSVIYLSACESAPKTVSGEKLSGEKTELTEQTISEEVIEVETKSGEENIIVEENKEEEMKTAKRDPKRYENVEKNPVVTMEMEDGGIVKIELYPQIAPTTVENFISLVSQDFYSGVIFHRVMPHFMAQGGDPRGLGIGGPGYTIEGEFSENGFTQNNLKHDIGVISMARATDPNSAGSQFFIVTDENSYQSLDGKYAGFGKVIEGMDEVYKIVNVPVNRSTDDLNKVFEKLMAGQQDFTDEEVALIQAYQAGDTFDRPIDPPVIKSMSVETFGVEYEEPAKIISK